VGRCGELVANAVARARSVVPRVPAKSLPPVALAVSFIDCINRADVDGLGRLMSDDHALSVFEERPLVGRDANLDAWRGYVERFPNYVIYPHRIADNDGIVAILGHTTGSHLELPDAEEQRLTLIWLAAVANGAVRSWTLIEDTPGNRRRFGLDTSS
jgi:hypothetical protein